MSQAPRKFEKSPGTPEPFPVEHFEPTTRLQAGRHHHLHRLQSLRGGLPGMERLSIARDGVRQLLPDHAGDGLEYWNLIKFNEVERSDGSIEPG